MRLVASPSKALVAGKPIRLEMGWCHSVRGLRMDGGRLCCPPPPPGFRMMPPAPTPMDRSTDLNAHTHIYIHTHAALLVAAVGRASAQHLRGLAAEGASSAVSTHTHTRVVRVAPDRPMTDQPARPPIYLSNKTNADANKADVKPYFLPIKNAGKIPRVDHDYHDALKSTWEGLKVSQSPYSRLRVGGSDMVCPYSRLQ